MTQTSKTPAREKAESLYFWGRFVLAGATIVAALWVQFVGDGVRELARDFVGVNLLKQRLDYIEDVLPPPPVVEWILEASGQIGECTSALCNYRVVGGRTEFGESCGAPVEIVYRMRAVASGRQTVIQSAPHFQAVELTRIPDDIIIPLQIPPSLPSGAYVWRSEVTYASCVGPREPIVRFSPWWPLQIGTEQ